MKTTTADKNQTTVKIKRGLIHDKVVTTTYDAEGNVVNVSESQGKPSWLTLIGCGAAIAIYVKLGCDYGKIMEEYNKMNKDYNF